MENRNVFVATIQVAIIAGSHSEACDCMAAIFSENLMGTGPIGSGVIIDWAYLPNGEGGYNSPVDKGEVQFPIEEGELFPNLK